MHTFKVSVIITVLLCIILVTGIIAYKTLSTTAEKMENHIVKIERSTTAQDWETAEKQISVAKNDWKDIEKVWSVLVDHFEIDNIDNTLSKIAKYIETKNVSMALAETATLRRYIKHIPEKEAFTLKNIL